MRSTIVTVLLGLSLVTGCEVGSAGGGGGGGGGDDTSGGGGPDAAVAVPKLAVTVDKPTIATELNSSNMVTVSLTGSGGFSGAVNVTASVVDGTGAPLAGWTVTLDKPTVTLAANGTGSAVATLKIPGTATTLAGKIKLDVTSSLGAESKLTDVTALKQVSIEVKEDALGKCVYPATNNITVKAGTKIRFVNKFAADPIIIHGSGLIPHETINATGTAPGLAYEVTPPASGVGSTGTGSWYCHSPGQDPAVDPTVTFE